MSRHLRQLQILALVFAALLLASTGVAATSPALDERPSRGTGDVSEEVARKAAAISRQTMSPFCPGRTLDDCPSGYATEWRRDIRDMVERGMSAAEIQRELESRVRGDLSGIPNRDSSYLFPVALALGAGLILFLVFLRLGRRDEAKKREEDQGADSKKASLEPASDERLQAELERED